MKAYKVFNPDWTCLDFQYKVGETYEIDGEPIMCEHGFHACKNAADCFNYYVFDSRNKVAEVELSGTILGIDGNKQCASRIEIKNELTWNEVLSLVNTGVGNSGCGNSGNNNNGSFNSGYENSGYWNSGHWNSGHRNSGCWNSGCWNSGHWNSGHRNSGFFNSITPDNIIVFNKLCNRDVWEESEKPNFIYDIKLNEWINLSNITDNEKKQHPEAEMIGGYLKTYSYKEAWKNAYDKATDEDIELLKALPNFDPKVFEEITGIKIK